jgi:2',3'-cyclic-nucleotide 2'-phosphodiesterase (5'-nucleotidase family)
MNTMGFDAMVLGNHEFDWGLDVVTGYFDGNTENGEASFPLLGANVFYQGTTNIVEHIDPYTIIERDGIKIGIIGTMGYGLEQSIAQSRIDGFVFASPSDYIETYATHLRTEEDVDYVFALTHDPGDLNQTVAGFTGDAKVDIIFNAHSHSRYTTTINNTSIIQSGSNGKYVGTITIDLTTNGITMKNEASSADFYKANADVQTLIDTYKAETDVLFNTEIIQSGAYASQTHLSNWLTDLMVAKTGADIAFHNYGGTRTYISEDESITLGKLYQIFPFDNIIKTVELDGSAINTFINKGNAYSTTVSEFQTGTKYLVATNDYLFDKTDNPFIYGDNPNYDGTLLRDMVEAELKLQALVYNNFTVDNPLLTNAVTQTSTYQAIINFYN